MKISVTHFQSPQTTTKFFFRMLNNIMPPKKFQSFGQEWPLIQQLKKVWLLPPKTFGHCPKKYGHQLGQPKVTKIFNRSS